MPWNNQNGGGGPWGAGGGSGGKKNPWGQAPKGAGNSGDDGKGHRPNGSGGGGSHHSPPDMDDLLRKGQERLKQFGGGTTLAVALLALILFWVFQSFYIVQQDEQAVELLFGKPKEKIIGEGPHFRLWPIETYHKVSLMEHTINIGGSEASSLMLSSDQNIVNISFSVYYIIENPAAYLFNVNEPVSTIQQVSESAMREVVGRRPATDVYRNELQAVASEVMEIIQSTLNDYQIGVSVRRVAINEAGPPREVLDAFQSVQRAEQERQRAIDEGNEYLARRLGEANGQASRIREAAAAQKFRIVEEARGQAQRFIAVANEAKNAPESTRFRLYLETMEQVFSSPNKLVLDNSGSGAVPYLPLGEMMRPGNVPRTSSVQGASQPMPQPVGQARMPGDSVSTNGTVLPNPVTPLNGTRLPNTNRGGN